MQEWRNMIVTAFKKRNNLPILRILEFNRQPQFLAATPKGDLIIRNPIIREDAKTGLAVNFAGGNVALFYKKGKAPHQG